MLSNKPKLKVSFGTCSYAKTSPPPGSLSPETKILNVVVPFEEALKLSLAIDEGVRRLNSYNRSTRAGKRSALIVAIHLDLQRVSVHEGKA